MRHDSAIVQAITMDELEVIDCLTSWEPSVMRTLPDEDREEEWYDDYTTEELDFGDEEV